MVCGTATAPIHLSAQMALSTAHLAALKFVCSDTEPCVCERSLVSARMDCERCHVTRPYRLLIGVRPTMHLCCVIHLLIARCPIASWPAIDLLINYEYCTNAISISTISSILCTLHSAESHTSDWLLWAGQLLLLLLLVLLVCQQAALKD